MSASKRPNVIVFFTDQQRWDTTGAHGNPLDLTPNFDRMARRGTHFYHAFTPQPVCGPARSVMQTGQYATTTGCWQNGEPLSPQADTIAKRFRAAGYQTGYIGKWHLAGGHGAVAGEKRGGYDYWLASNALEFTSDAYQTTLYNEDGEPVELPGYRVDALTDAAIRFIDNSQSTPFFLFLSFIEPHHQNHRDDYPAPDGYEERYQARYVPPDLAALPGFNDGDPNGGSAHRHLGGYYGMVKRLDEALGRMLDALKSLGLEEDTIVLFTSDHGNHFKTRNSEYKRSCHEASIRVPMAACGPGFESGGQVRELASLVDVAPTLLDAAGLEVPDTMQGRSLLPLTQRRAAEWPDDVFIQISESHIGRAVRTARWKYGVVSDENTLDGQGGAQRYRETELYDLKADPWELVNLIDKQSHRPVADRMRQRLLRRMSEIGEALPEIETVEGKPSGQRRVSEAEIDA